MVSLFAQKRKINTDTKLDGWHLILNSFIQKVFMGIRNIWHLTQVDTHGPPHFCPSSQSLLSTPLSKDN